MLLFSVNCCVILGMMKVIFNDFVHRASASSASITAVFIVYTACILKLLDRSTDGRFCCPSDTILRALKLASRFCETPSTFHVQINELNLLFRCEQLIAKYIRFLNFDEQAVAPTYCRTQKLIDQQ